MLLVLMLCAVVSMQAQSLIGNWKTTITDNDEKMDFYFMFYQKTLDMKVTVHMVDNDGKMTLSVSVPGNYTVDGSTLSLKMKPDDVVINIEALEFEGKVIDMSDPEIKELWMGMILPMIEEHKTELIKDLPIDGELEIKSLTSNELILITDGDNPEVLTFIRQ